MTDTVHPEVSFEDVKAILDFDLMTLAGITNPELRLKFAEKLSGDVLSEIIAEHNPTPSEATKLKQILATSDFKQLDAFLQKNIPDIKVKIISLTARIKADMIRLYLFSLGPDLMAKMNQNQISVNDYETFLEICDLMDNNNWLEVNKQYSQLQGLKKLLINHK